MSPQSAPLSDNELAELDTFLLSEEDDRLPIDEAHGFMTALLVSHATVSDEELIEAICGDASFGSDSERQRVTSLLLRMRDEIVASLQSKAPFEPMVIEEEEDGETFEVYEGWCFGFMLGVTNQSERWDHITKEQEELLAPIAQMALLHTEEEEMDEEEYELCVELLPGAVNALYSSWNSR
jgi:uncharacterized protein